MSQPVAKDHSRVTRSLSLTHKARIVSVPWTKKGYPMKGEEDILESALFYPLGQRTCTL